MWLHGDRSYHKSQIDPAGSGTPSLAESLLCYHQRCFSMLYLRTEKSNETKHLLVIMLVRDATTWTRIITQKPDWTSKQWNTVRILPLLPSKLSSYAILANKVRCSRGNLISNMRNDQPRLWLRLKRRSTIDQDGAYKAVDVAFCVSPPRWSDSWDSLPGGEGLNGR